MTEPIYWEIIRDKDGHPIRLEWTSQVQLERDFEAAFHERFPKGTRIKEREHEVQGWVKDWIAKRMPHKRWIAKVTEDNGLDIVEEA